MPTIKLRLPSNRTLGNICVYGAVLSISAVMYMRWKLEDRVRNTEYYKLALQTLRQHKGAVGLLGAPIKETGFDMSDQRNMCNAEKAQFEVKVRGTKDKGTLYFWATNDLQSGWLIERLELEAKKHPDKRFLLKKPGQNQLPENMNKNKATPSTVMPPQFTQKGYQEPQSKDYQQPAQNYQQLEQSYQQSTRNYQQSAQDYQDREFVFQQSGQEPACDNQQPTIYSPQQSGIGYETLKEQQQEPEPYIQTAEGGRML